MFEEWEPGDAEVQSLFEQVGLAVSALHEMLPQLDSKEEEWFAAGMHESPFAAPMGIMRALGAEE